MSFSCLQFSQKTNKNNLTWGTIVVKSNFFVCFLGELKIQKRHLEINWPLEGPFELVFFMFSWAQIQVVIILLQLYNTFRKFRNISGIHIRKNRIFCNKHFQKDLRTLSLHWLAFFWLPTHPNCKRNLWNPCWSPLVFWNIQCH